MSLLSDDMLASREVVMINPRQIYSLQELVDLIESKSVKIWIDKTGAPVFAKVDTISSQKIGVVVFEVIE